MAFINIPDLIIQHFHLLVEEIGFGMLTVGFMLLLWVFIRRAIQSSQARPEDAGKLGAIRDGVRRLFSARTH